jgi:hypothetical protein
MKLPKSTYIQTTGKRTPISGFFFFMAVCLLSLSSCSYFKKKIIGEDEKPLARAFENYLYPSDLNDLTKGMTPEDSARVVKAVVEKWLQRQLLLKKAKDNIPDDDPSIMRKVEDYRESLILYEYEKALITDKLDTTIKQSDIEKYYEQFADNFPLQNDVYLVQFIKLKEEAPELKNFKKLLQNIRSEEDEQQIEGYCKANASAYAFAHPLWYGAENLKTVFMLSDNEISALSVSEKFKEFNKEDGSILFFRVRNLKRKGEQSPIELARTDIAKILIEKRKMQLIDNFYNRVFKEGISSKNAELYVQ